VKLHAKFIVTLGPVLLISFGLTFLRTARFQDQLVILQAERQARMLSQQIILTRKWVADHNGLFFAKRPGVEANPFLPDREVVARDGTTYVKRNPAMVTRELSDYAANSDFCRFRVTSLYPVNSANAPDEFESEALKAFEQGESEVIRVVADGGGRELRYVTPLIVEESCLECHGQHGYTVGDIRGGLSLTVPMEWADNSISANNRLLFAIAVATILIVGLVVYWLMDFMVVKRLRVLTGAMAAFPEEGRGVAALKLSRDEIGLLSQGFSALATRLIASQEELERTRQQMFQAEKMASLGRLSAGIAHEVNNPLGGMRNCVKSMRDAPEDRGLQARYLELLDKGLQRIEKTMRQLLNFGRPEPLQARPVAVDEVIRECLDLLAYRMRDIELELELSLSFSLALDAEAVKQVVLNLLLNAIQAMPTGGRLLVRTGMGQGEVSLMFRDSGVGIAAEEQPRIFDPFYTTKEVGQGTGLGLSVSYALVHRMGGDIQVASAPGQGSTFTVRLPVAG
jgi:signal transduction histidine kinase